MVGGEPRSAFRLLSGWAGLGRFWIIVAGAVGCAALTLQLLGPPPSASRPPRTAGAVPDPAEKPTAAAPTAAPVKANELTHAAVAPPKPPVAVLSNPGRNTPGAIADPDPALLAANMPPGDGLLPRIAADGRTPMHEYAAGFDPTTRRARVGLIIGGIGLNAADSLAAVQQAPLGVTLAVSPYAHDTDRLLGAARIAQHEYLLSIPME